LERDNVQLNSNLTYAKKKEEEAIYESQRIENLLISSKSKITNLISECMTRGYIDLIEFYEGLPD